MNILNKLPSLSIFFPCYNDKGTIGTLVIEAGQVAKNLTADFEIIVIDDGSTDGSRELLAGMEKEITHLKVVYHEKNRGYGGALRSGFANSKKEWVFYTDGDGQYDVKELPLLAAKVAENIDVVNGYKRKRRDPLHRIIIGFVYQYAMKFFFHLPIKDPDCDFRLIRKSLLEKINLTSTTGTITIELVKKLQLAGARFTEVGVSHYFRLYGKSQFFNFKRVAITLWRLIFLWFELFIPRIKQHFKNVLLKPTVGLYIRRILELDFYRHKKLLIKHYPKFKVRPNILDFGCGTGVMSDLFTRSNYNGVDIDETSIKYAKLKHAGNFLVFDGKTIPFPDAYFDFCFVVGVFHHLDDLSIDQMLSEIKRVLKPNAELLIIEDTKTDFPLTRFVQTHDQGKFIRAYDGWKKCFEKLFTIRQEGRYFCGISSYSYFLVSQDKQPLIPRK